MSIVFSESIAGIDWARLAIVFERAPLASRHPLKIQEAFQNSQIRCFVWDDGDLIGAGRALTDGVWTTVVFDVVLLPEYQGRGIGTAIMKFLADRSKAAKVLLYSAPGQRGFLCEARLSEAEDGDGEILAAGVGAAASAAGVYRVILFFRADASAQRGNLQLQPLDFTCQHILVELKPKPDFD